MRVHSATHTAAVRTAAPRKREEQPGSVDRVELGARPLGAATPDFTVAQRLPSSRWAFTEVLSDNDPHFVQRNFHPRQRLRDPELIEAFGSDTPHSGKVLLHYAGEPPAGVEKRPYPVLLVHGANKNGNFWWDPKEDGSNQGVPQRLKAEGFDVYAVSFAHNQDDNDLWAEQVANAISRIKELTGAEKVDLVGHSKGGMPTRMYTSNVGDEWRTPYREDVHRLVLIGAPNGGIDYSFRHSSVNYGLFKDSDEPLLNAPMSWDKIMHWGRMKDASELGFGSDGPDYWPGQRQMLSRLDHLHDLPKIEADWYTTYHGGRGFVSQSKGIDHYIEEGENLIERLNQTPVDDDIEVALLAGDAADIPGILNEYTGPSDGLVFVDSALQMSEGTRVIAREVKHLHHKALVSDDEGQQWLLDILSRDSFEAPEPKEKLVEKSRSLFKSRPPQGPQPTLPEESGVQDKAQAAFNPTVLTEL